MIEITIRQDSTVAINLIAVVSLFLLLAFIAALLRIPARRYTRQKLNFSDYAVFMALVRPILSIYLAIQSLQLTSSLCLA